MKFKMEESRRGFCGIKDIIPDVISQLNLDTPFFLGQIQEKWESIAGSILSTHSCPVKKIGDTLYIEADHSVFANDINMMKKMLLEKIREVCGNKGVENLKVTIKKTSLRRFPK